MASWINNSDEVVTYLDETTKVSRWYEDPDYLETDQDDSWTDARGHSGIDNSICARGLPSQESRDVVMTTGGTSLLKPLDEVENSRAGSYAMLHAVTPAHESYNRALLSATPRTESSTFHGSPESTSSRSYSTVHSLPVSAGPGNPMLTQREAVLMRNFTDHMALWVSITNATVLSPKSSLTATSGRYH